MKVLACDDEKIVLDYINKILSSISIINETVCFTKPHDVLTYLKHNEVDVCFLDIEMFEMNGITLAKKIKDLCPQTSIIFVTAYQNYAIDAFKVHANGYLLKPIKKEDVLIELNSLKELKKERYSGVRIQTFGNFEIYNHEEIVTFSRTKSKELIAYLVDKKGTTSTISEIICTLWEDKEVSKTTRSMFHNLLTDIKTTLKNLNIPLFVKSKHNAYYIDFENIKCDYIDFLNGDIKAINNYTGQYMNNYSWAEFTSGYLDYQKYN